MKDSLSNKLKRMFTGHQVGVTVNDHQYNADSRYLWSTLRELPNRKLYADKRIEVIAVKPETILAYLADYEDDLEKYGLPRLKFDEELRLVLRLGVTLKRESCGEVVAVFHLC